MMNLKRMTNILLKGYIYEELIRKAERGKAPRSLYDR